MQRISSIRGNVVIILHAISIVSRTGPYIALRHHFISIIQTGGLMTSIELS